MSGPSTDQTLEDILNSLSEYRIDKNDVQDKFQSLGFGGYGDVKLAELTGRLGSAGKLVAVKQLRSPSSKNQPRHLAIITARELRVWAKLTHPNILPLTAFCIEEDTEVAWFISPYEENGNIREYLDREKPTRSRRLLFLQDTAEGVAYLHAMGICHGDIKAENILIGQDLRAKLCDFGLARVVEIRASGLTTTRGLKGTVRFLSPELVTTEMPVRTFETDVWAWACLPLEIIFDTRPYAETRVDAMVYACITKGEAPASLEGLDMPEVLSSLLSHCWQVSPERRPTMAMCSNTAKMTVILDRGDVSSRQGTNLFRMAVAVLPLDHPDLPHALHELAEELGKQLGYILSSTAPTSEPIELLRQAHHLRPTLYPSCGDNLANLPNHCGTAMPTSSSPSHSSSLDVLTDSSQATDGHGNAKQHEKRPHLYVDRLSPRLTEPQLMEMFAVAGPISSVRIIRSHNFNLNYGFVEYIDMQSAEKAIPMFDGRKVFYDKIHVEWAYRELRFRRTSLPLRGAR